MSRPTRRRLWPQSEDCQPFRIEAGAKETAALLLVSHRLSKTTGHVIPVEGGLQDGFLR